VTRVVVRQVAARARARERQRERDRRELEHGTWLEQAIATMYARLDAGRQALEGWKQRSRRSLPLCRRSSATRRERGSWRSVWSWTRSRCSG
jgi:alkylation response protein AidB-like acyl-CoA dehydrogenase